MPVTTSTTLTNQFQNYFSKELLSIVQQETILDQFAMKAPIPKNNGNRGISMFRFGAPSIASVQPIAIPSAYSGEGTPISSANYRALALNKLEKSLAQYGQVIGLTDILRATDLFNSLQQATKTSGLDMALWVDSVIRNTLIGSNLTLSGSVIGTGPETGTVAAPGAFDNADRCNDNTAAGGINVYGNPATLTTQTFSGLNSATAAADATMTSSAILDSMTRLKRNRAPMINGSYVLATDPRVARDLMRDDQWLNASNYGNKGQPFYKGEVGSIYGCRVITQTNSFVSQGSAVQGDQFVYSTAGGGGLLTGKDIIASFFLGNEAFGIPHLTGDDPLSPKIVITDTPDKSDPLNQLVTVGVKIFFTTLRLAAGNTGSTGNPVWYLVHRTKTSTTI
jgi:N4-gp56 family major capsid protein